MINLNPPHNLRCEYHANPLGIDVTQPRLSWEMDSQRPGAAQTAYRVLVAASEADLLAENGTLWDSGQVLSNASAYCVYKGTALGSRQQCYWRVQLWDETGAVSGWSQTAVFETALLHPSDWHAHWITPAQCDDSSQMQPCPHLRTRFTLQGKVAQARLYVTSLGCYELWLNGRRVGDGYFTPGWSSYHHRLQYQTYDVGDLLLKEGTQTLGAILADGWYRGYTFGLQGLARNHYGDTLALLLQLEIRYTNGRSQTITTDGSGSWQATTGPIRHADHYMGERYDARLERPGWATGEDAPDGWGSVVVYDHPKSHLVAQTGSLVKKIEEVAATAVLTTPAGETVVDFGQNVVGWVRLRLRGGEAGTAVTLHHAEILDQHGNFYTANLRTAQQEVTYICGTENDDRRPTTDHTHPSSVVGGRSSVGQTAVYEPRFTFQGFRYVRVTGYPGELELGDLTAVVLHSALTPSGDFSCSNELINQLQRNIVCGQKGNFLDVPTDCPQRDERLGWTGDAQVFIPTACFNMDVASFFTRWLRDLAADQRADGAYPWVAPNTLGSRAYAATGWADAGVICPWVLYLHYGDSRIMAEQYASMGRWIAFMQQQADDDLIWRSGFHFGDWLATDRDDLTTPFGLTENDLVATAFFAHSTTLMSRIAAVLGNVDDATGYANLADNIRVAFCREFVTENGRIGSNTQTAYVLALMFDLLPKAQRPEAARRLVANIRARNNHLATGFLGTPYLCHVLTRFGYLDVAYDLLLQESCPSWLYPIKLGATTIWERWDGIKADGSFHDAGMNSFNHYAYGAIGEWLYDTVAGLRFDESQPGFQHAIIHPQPGGGITHARASRHTLYGTFSVAWELAAGQFTLTVTVPPNASATVYLPDGEKTAVFIPSGTHSFSCQANQA